MTEAFGDPWTYRRDLAGCRARLALASVAWVCVEHAVELDDLGRVVVTVTPPWWARLTLGLWIGNQRRAITARCAMWVPRICGWCPEVIVK